ncbi:hypothetical protein GCM10027405_37570 [Arthrobacter alkaliphilus]|uniref:hypothetical protein n=1 Tax=Arthrobacter alkaliphilus TaxID=369936 RepID=UPI001F21C25B|nr:hypothetical protein [Arthrobacter alkaliphilus]
MVTKICDGKLINGPTAYSLLRLRFRLTTVALILLAILLILSRSGMPQSWFTNLMVLVALGSVIPVTVLVGRVPARERAEKEAGYTTLQQGAKNLEQRDPYLGRVIRKPGDDYLDKTQFHDIIRPAKDEVEKRSRN